MRLRSVCVILGYLCLMSFSALSQNSCEQAASLFKSYARDCPTFSEDYYCLDVDVSNSVNPNSTRTNFTWYMGDGTVKKGVRAKHCYQKEGTYTITLIASSFFGNTTLKDTTYHTVEINRFVHITSTVLENKQLYLDGSKSFIDYDTPISAYYWDLGDGNFLCQTQNPLAYHQFLKAGTYTIRLIVEGKSKTTGELKQVGGSLVVTVN